jgi:all-trans-retinol 13,14-reductase
VRSTSTATNRPWSRTAPDGPWDALVIGSGMGGMACGALLADFGKRVLILEQHYVPGGMTHVFQRQGYTWDVGVHAVGEVSSDGRFGQLVQRLGRGRVEWVSLGPVCDEFHYPDGRQIDVADSPEKMARNLREAFPDQRESIDRYLGRVRAVAAAMQDHFLGRAFGRRLSTPPGNGMGGLGIDHWIHQRTSDVLRSLTASDELIAVLSAQWGYYGADPMESSFAVHALVVDHFLNGGFYPRGGAAAIARGLLGTVAEAGGWTRVGASVAGLLRDDRGAVTGVRLDDGEEIHAPRVVSAIGGRATVHQLLDDDDRRAEWAGSIASLAPSPAYLCLYIGLEGDIRQAGASAANRWFFETWRHDLDQWHIDAIPDPIPILYTSFPSLKDPDHDPGPRQRHTAEVVTFVDHDDFVPYTGDGWRRRSEGYEEIKEQLTRRLLDQLLKHMPGLESMIRYVELSTPVSTTHFTRATGGAIYGLKPTPARFENPWLRPRTPIEGLYLSGVDVASVGVMGAFIGGVLTAVSMEPVKAMRLFRELG